MSASIRAFLKLVAPKVLLPLVIAAFVLASPFAAAAEAVATAQDPIAAAREVHLAQQLRCLVCQNQTIAESNADLALDLRRQIREQIAGGRTDDQILQYMVDRYSDFVLYNPPFKGITLLLWLGPGVLLVIGVTVLAQVLRSRRAPTESASMSAEDRARAARLLSGDVQEGNT